MTREESCVETCTPGQYPHGGDAGNRAVTTIRKSVLATAMLACALALAGCMQTQEIDETLPPYASISDEGREPPKSPPPDDDSSGGFMSAIGSVLMFPVRMIEAL